MTRLIQHKTAEFAFLSQSEYERLVQNICNFEIILPNFCFFHCSEVWWSNNKGSKGCYNFAGIPQAVSQEFTLWLDNSRWPRLSDFIDLPGGTSCLLRGDKGGVTTGGQKERYTLKDKIRCELREERLICFQYVSLTCGTQLKEICPEMHAIALCGHDVTRSRPMQRVGQTNFKLIKECMGISGAASCPKIIPKMLQILSKPILSWSREV